MSTKSILVVDDEEKIRTVINIYLKKEGYTVKEAKDGKEALEALQFNEFSLIILDVMMPEVDGWTVCREIRKSSSVPVIMLTARSAEYDKLFGFDLGVDDYITKPFSPKEMVARIQAILRRSQTIESAKTNELLLGNIKINPDSKQVFLEKEEIFLTPKEYDLLHFLIKNPKKVFTREQLLNMVWGYDFYGDLRTVDTHIKQLRGKLGKNKKYMRTVWGTGYKFEIGE